MKRWLIIVVFLALVLVATLAVALIEPGPLVPTPASGPHFLSVR